MTRCIDGSQSRYRPNKYEAKYMYCSYVCRVPRKCAIRVTRKRAIFITTLYVTAMCHVTLMCLVTLKVCYIGYVT